MAITQTTYTGNGSITNYSFTFEYLKQADVKVTLNSVATTAFTFANATTLAFSSAPANGVAIRIFRDTVIDTLSSTFFPGSAIKAEDLNQNFTQNLYVTQESDAEAASATTTANGAVTTANAATATANGAVTTANSANTKSDAAVATANTSNTAAAAAVTTANTASTNATTAVNTANTANTTAASAVTTANAATTTANGAVTTANAATATANTASTNASAAVATANTANTTAGNAVTSANSAVSTANSSNTTAASAVTTANGAVSTANTASTNATAAVNTANAASTAVSNAVLFTLIANVASIPGSPSNNDYIEIGNSTGVQSFSPLSGLPSGFVGASGLTVRLRYDSSASSWVFMNYFANDSEDRYLTKNIPVVTGDSTNGSGQITLNCENNSHGIKIKGPPHSASANYTLTLPNNTGTSGQALITNGSGVSSWSSVLPLTGGTLTGGLNTSSFINVADGGIFKAVGGTDTNSAVHVSNQSGNLTASIKGNGSATFAGNVGIGTSTISRKFVVSGGSSEAVAQFTNTTSGVGADDGFQILHFNNGYTQLLNRENESLSFGTSNSERLRIDSSGRLLVGTTTEGHPSANELTVASSGITGITIRSGTSDSGNLFFSDGTSGNDELRGYIQYLHADNALVLAANALEALRIDSSGRLLVGTTTEGAPAADNLTLQDSGSCGLTIRAGASDYSTIYLSNATSGAGEYAGSLQYGHADNSLRIGTNSAERLRIDSSGRVGIGASSFNDAQEALRVQSSSGGTDTLLTIKAQSDSGKSILNFGDSDFNEGRVIYDHSSNSMQFLTDDSERMRIDSTGKLLLGTSSGTSVIRSHFDGTGWGGGNGSNTTSGLSTPQFLFDGVDLDNSGTVNPVGFQIRGGGGGVPRGYALGVYGRYATSGLAHLFFVRNTGASPHSSTSNVPGAGVFRGDTDAYGSPAGSSWWNYSAPANFGIKDSVTGTYDGSSKVGQTIELGGTYGGGSQNNWGGTCSAVRIATNFGASSNGTNIGYYADISAAGSGNNWGLYIANGGAAKPGGGSFTATSDARVKNVFGNYERGLNELLQLNPVKFAYNGKAKTPADDQERIGLLAQDVQPIMPELVSSRSEKLNEDDEENTNILMVDPSDLVFTLVNAIKELSAQNAALEQRLTDAGIA